MCPHRFIIDFSAFLWYFVKQSPKVPYNSIPSFILITSLFTIIYLIRYNSILLFSHAFQLMNQNYKHVDSNFIVFPVDDPCFSCYIIKDFIHFTKLIHYKDIDQYWCLIFLGFPFLTNYCAALHCIIYKPDFRIYLAVSQSVGSLKIAVAIKNYPICFV